MSLQRSDRISFPFLSEQGFYYFENRILLLNPSNSIQTAICKFNTLEIFIILLNNLTILSYLLFIAFVVSYCKKKKIVPMVTSSSSLISDLFDKAEIL